MRKLVISIILLVFISPVALAQEVQKNGIYVFDDWSAGLATKVSPFKLQKNQSDIAENVRFGDELGAFSKRDVIVSYGTADATEPILGMHRLYKSDGTKTLLVNYSDKIAKGDDATGILTDIFTSSTSDRRAKWLTWHDMAIGTDGYNQPVKYDGSSDSATNLGSCLATDAGSGAGPDGVYAYKVTCYTATYELSLDTPSNTITVVDNDIDLSMIPICPDTFLGEDVTGRKIYRTGTGDSTYKKLSNGTIANNTAVTLTDSDADGARTDALSPTSTAAVPKGKLSLIHKNRMWIANNPDNPSRIYYSDESSHDYFPAINYFDIRKNDGDEITIAMNLLGKLTVGKNNSIQKIYTDGDDPAEDWEISDPFSFIGCHGMYSAVNTPIGIIYLGNNGLYVFNGQYSLLISDLVTPVIKDINPTNFPSVWGEIADNKYYMAYTSNATGASYNNRALVYDIPLKAFSVDTMNINVFNTFKSGSDVEALFSGASDSGNIYAHNETIKEIIHKTHDDFTGTFDDMRFIPESIGGDSEDPVLELAWDVTMDSLTTVTMDSLITEVIDRPSIGGSYVSQSLNINASSFDKIYWNESIPASGGDVRLRIRSAATAGGLAAASWSGFFSNSSGSDISSESAYDYAQYLVTMDTTNIAYTPTVYKSNNYVVRMTYNTTGGNAEGSIPLRVRSGWTDLGIPGYKKTLRKIDASYESDETGTLNITFETIEGDSDIFEIDLNEYPSRYVAYFTSGALTGTLLRIDVQEDSLNALKGKRIVVLYDVEPIY